jgi:hydrogenase maturation protease
MKRKKMGSTLLFAIGNYSRGDDALGWLFADELARLELNIKIEYRYQLQVEDADLLRSSPQVIFTDAAKDNFASGFRYYAVKPALDYSFTTHSLSAGTLLQLSSELYNFCPKARMMAISGSSWGLGNKPSAAGMRNLKNALSFFEQHWMNNVDS